jgi:uncharacterized protein YhbP (UPF0306 family)
MTKFTEMARDIIKNNKFLSLATRNNKGEVWATPLSYSIDADINFYFTTAIDSVHIDHIRENPYVAFSIFNSTRNVSDIDGVQIKGIVGEVERDKLLEIVPEYYHQVFPDPIERKEWEADWENFTKDEFPVYRFFKIVPIEIYKRDTDNVDVDRRVQINIDDLRKMINHY